MNEVKQLGAYRRIDRTESVQELTRGFEKPRLVFGRARQPAAEQSPADCGELSPRHMASLFGPLRVAAHQSAPTVVTIAGVWRSALVYDRPTQYVGWRRTFMTASTRTVPGLIV